jgi:cytochrome b561
MTRGEERGYTQSLFYRVKWMKYTLPQRVMHWLMAAMIIALLMVGLVMEDLPAEYKFQVYGLHKSFGVLVLVLWFGRAYLKWRHGQPVLPKGIPLFEQRLSQVGHKLLYLLMLAMPLSGYVMSNAKGHGVALFGLPLPRLVGENKVLGAYAAEAHELLAWALIALLVVHVGALVWHLKQQKTNIFERMW